VRRAGVAVTVVVLAAVAAACGDDGGAQGAARETTTTTAPEATTSPTSTATAAGSPACGLKGASDITIPSGRGEAKLHGVLTGSGPTAIVLAHEFRADACDWAFFVPELAAPGRQVLAFDFSGDGSSDVSPDGRLDLDVLAAVRQVRDRGATKVVVIGASKGGTAAVTAAAAPQGGIAGVVSLSAVASYLQADAEAAAATVKVPVLFAAAEDDSSTAEVAQTLATSCGCAFPKVLVFHGDLHGTRMLTNGTDGPTLRTAIDQLIARATQ
jgi:pimeloyl-ACP methyl ester carboxylesterase